jgi:two-component system NtrC family sensor kinase
MNGKGCLRIGVREAAPLNGEFVLRPRPAGQFVELVVSDTGPGIEAEIRSRIFEPFYSTKPQSAGSGTGLGLSLVHSLAEQEGMGICLNSAPDKGTRFTVLIPVDGA